jgi:hypothetical protein
VDHGPRWREGSVPLVLGFSLVGRRTGTVLVAASSRIKSLRLPPYLDGDVEKLVEVVWFLRTSSGWGEGGSPDRHGASSVVIPSSLSPGWMWSS